MVFLAVLWRGIALDHYIVGQWCQSKWTLISATQRPSTKELDNRRESWWSNEGGFQLVTGDKIWHLKRWWIASISCQWWKKTTKCAMEVELESYKGRTKDACKEQASDVCSVGGKVLLCRGSWSCTVDSHSVLPSLLLTHTKSLCTLLCSYGIAIVTAPLSACESSPVNSVCCQRYDLHYDMDFN